MALIPNRIVRISMAYKIWCCICLFIAAECFFWDLYTHKLLEETQAELRKSQENLSTALEYIRVKQQEDCYDGNK